MEIIAILIIAFAVIGLVSNFVFIFFMPANDRLNEEYFDKVDNPWHHEERSND